MSPRAKTSRPLHDASSLSSSREDQLLDIARRLFAHKGFHATSLRDIAEEAHITKAALYYHFPNKDDLYERVVIQSLDALIQTVTADVARAHTPTEQVQAFMHSSAHFLDQHREHWLAGANAFHEAGQNERRSVALHLRDTYEKLLRRCIAEGIASGEFRHLDAAISTRFLLSGLNYMTRWHSPSGKLSVKEVMSQFVDMALFGMREPSLPMSTAAAPQAAVQQPRAQPTRARQKAASRA